MIKRLSSRVVYENPWMTVREDQVEFPGGHRGIYGVVEKPDFALVVPWDGERFHLVRQFRYPVAGAFWEFPQGSSSDPALSPIDVARLELAEESGLSAESLEEIGFLYQANGYSGQGFHVFVATGLGRGTPRREATEAGMEARTFALTELESMIVTGQVRDAPTVSAYGLLKLRNMIP